jgi:FkbM family methyltransferase
MGIAKRLFSWVVLLPACVLPACTQEEAAKNILETEKKLYSQFDEELIIRDFFQDRRDGLFLDVGAGDPKRFSTTYYLEKHLGWKGFAIDALPGYAPRYEAERPNAKFFNYIVTDHAGTVDEFYMVKGVPDLSSTIKDREFDGKKLAAETIHIPTMTLNQFLDDQGVEKIDFLSMDIERGAPKALAAFDIQRFKPELVCIEAGAGEDYRQVIAKWFEDHGYRRIEKYLKHDWSNWYYTPKD